MRLVAERIMAEVIEILPVVWVRDKELYVPEREM